MQYRNLGSTGMNVSTVSFGAWAIGGTWGPVDDEQSMAALHRALDLGVNFFDTADVYGDGRSERLLARLRRERTEPFFVATKAGRRLPKQVVEGYSSQNLREWVARSLKNLEVETLDLLQLHCPPSELYERDEPFQVLEDLKRAGLIQHYGISVEKVSEAVRGIQHPGVESVQIIFNAFRLKPTLEFFAATQARNVGILARVPLASGLLTGKITADSSFAPDDHRAFNRDGASFDKGETFSGVPFEVGLEAVAALQKLVPEGWTLAQFALRWIGMFEAVTCSIPGAKNPTQVEANMSAADLPPLSQDTMKAVEAIYDQFVRVHVQDLW
jgi:aryl-alcohol dehydrogenase-like predicted oxidoreductase